MKIVVLGAGLMGREIARALQQNAEVEKIILADISKLKVEQFIAETGSTKIVAAAVDAEDDQALQQVIEQGELIVNALYSAFNVKVAQLAIATGRHLLDLGGHVGGVTEQVLALNSEALEANVTIIPDLAVAPGIINIVTGYGVSKLDSVDSIRLFVGGIPMEPKPPLHYSRVFSLEGVFDHYTEPAQIVEKGKLVPVDSLSGVEPVYFDGFGVLEAFYTAGSISTLPKSFPDVKTLECKTVRYKGHAEKFKLLADLDFLSKDNFVQVDDQQINVRDVVRQALKNKLRLGEKSDAVLLRATIAGEKNEEQVKYEYEMVVKKDVEQNISAMACATSSTIATVVQLIAEGVIEKRGVVPSEKIVPGEAFILKMSERGIHITETVHRSSMIVKW